MSNEQIEVKTDGEIIADIKLKTLDQYKAWGLFVVAKQLNPGMDAKDFYKIFQTVTPKSLRGEVDISKKTFWGILKTSKKEPPMLIARHEKGFVTDFGMTGNYPRLVKQPEIYNFDVRTASADEIWGYLLSIEFAWNDDLHPNLINSCVRVVKMILDACQYKLENDELWEDEEKSLKQNIEFAESLIG
jgi:hypothetical protein